MPSCLPFIPHCVLLFPHSAESSNPRQHIFDVQIGQAAVASGFSRRNPPFKAGIGAGIYGIKGTAGLLRAVDELGLKRRAFIAIRCFSVKEQGPARNLPMSRPRMGILVVVWSGLAVLGLGAMLDFELTPALPGAPRSEWPSRSLLVRDPRRPTLLMFIHPHCPCSRASLAELSNLATSCRDRVSIEILFVKPADCDDDWEHTDLLTTAQRIPGVTVAGDRNGAESIRFGATTSGETLLFDSGGRLLFRGGITPSRGHEGGNLGRSTIEALVTHGSADVSAAPVYGCSLLNRCSLGEESRGQCNR